MSGSNTSGGFHFGNVDGGVKVVAKGDIVAGDKTTTTTTKTVKGFADDGKKQQFESQIEQLREALRALKGEIEGSKLDDDAKDEVSGEILQTVKALKEAKEMAAGVASQQEAPAEVATAVEGALARAGGITEKLKGIVTTTGEMAEAVGKFAAQYGPLVSIARQMFGLP